MLDSECSDSIILAFLQDPEVAPDSGCIADISQPEFFTSQSVIQLPVILKLLNLEDNTGWEALLLVLALLFLLTAAFFIPLAWLIRALQPKPTQAGSQAIPYASPIEGTSSSGAFEPAWIEKTGPPIFVRLSGWAAVLNGFILLAFVIWVIVAIVQMISNNDNRLFFGVAGEYRTAFILPLIATFLTFLMIAAAFQGWLWREWKVFRKLYYSLLTISAIICLFILGLWGMLVAFWA